MSWRFGDTTLYRFVLDVPPDTLIPSGTVVDFAMRTPNGVRIFEESQPLQLPKGNLPFFEIFISPLRSFDIPPGNYIFSVTIKRPYSGVGNYRFTPLPSAPVSVVGVYSITPNNLLDLEGDTDPPAPIIIHLDCEKMRTISAGSPSPGPGPVETYNPPTLSLTAELGGTPYLGESIVIILHATLIPGSAPFQNEVEFKMGSTLLDSQPAPPSGGNIAFTLIDLISNTTTFTVAATDGTTPVSTNYTVTFVERPSSIYYGVSADTPITDIESGLSRVQNKITGNDGVPFTLNGIGYAYIAFPASWGAPTRINDHNAFNVTTSYSKIDIEIATTPYFLYLASNPGFYDGDSDGDYVLIFK